MIDANHEIKVSVCVVTYNQENYIRECLQSLVTQEADFKFEIIVSDDCSTDKTPQIISEFYERYPTIIRPILHKENMGPYKNFIFVHSQASGKYIAHMDGDDYALPSKLQIQADFLDQNPRCNIVWTRMKILDNKNDIFYEDLLGHNEISNKKFELADLLSIGAIACHSSKMYRNNFNYKNLANKEFLDFYVDSLQLENSYGMIIQDVLGVYRSKVGISTDTDTQSILLDNLEDLVLKFPDHRDSIAALILKILLIDFKKGNVNVKALKQLIRSIGIRTPIYFIKNFRYIKYFRSPI